MDVVAPSQNPVRRAPALKAILLPEERGLPIGGPFTAK